MEIINVTGLAKFELDSTIPTFTGNGGINAAEHTVLHQMRLGKDSGDLQGNQFKTVYKKSKDEYLFVGTRQRFDRMTDYFEKGKFKMNMNNWYMGEECMKSTTCVQVNSNKYTGSAVTQARTEITLGVFSALSIVANQPENTMQVDKRVTIESEQEIGYNHVC